MPRTVKSAELARGRPVWIRLKPSGEGARLPGRGQDPRKRLATMRQSGGSSGEASQDPTCLISLSLGRQPSNSVVKHFGGSARLQGSR